MIAVFVFFLLSPYFVKSASRFSPNSFLSLIASFKNEHDKYSSNDVIDNIISNLEEEDFKKLNFGNLYIQFKNMGKQSSFQNFLEYTISDQYKDYKYYYELCNILCNATSNILSLFSPYV